MTLTQDPALLRPEERLAAVAELLARAWLRLRAGAVESERDSLDLDRAPEAACAEPPADLFTPPEQEQPT